MEKEAKIPLKLHSHFEIRGLHRENEEKNSEIMLSFVIRCLHVDNEGKKKNGRYSQVLLSLVFTRKISKFMVTFCDSWSSQEKLMKETWQFLFTFCDP